VLEFLGSLVLTGDPEASRWVGVKPDVDLILLGRIYTLWNSLGGNMELN
jgi:hypothetical protein